MKKTFEFTEQEAELLRKEQYKYLINDNIDHFLLLVQQIVSERITPEPKAMTEQEITNKEIYELECILEKVRKGGFMYTFAEAINDIENIFKPFMVQSAQITQEPGESGQSAEEIIRPDCYHEDPLSPVLVITKEHALQAMTTYASQVCADKDARIKELEGLLSSDSVYGLFRFAYKSPESAQVYEISKKLRELKTK